MAATMHNPKVEFSSDGGSTWDEISACNIISHEVLDIPNDDPQVPEWAKYISGVSIETTFTLNKKSMRQIRNILLRFGYSMRKAILDYKRSNRRRRAEFLAKGKHGMRRPK